ncbi:MAG: glycosyl transferase, partial [Pseudonocardiaceae bacterium]
WQQRHTWLGRTILAVTTAGTAVRAQTMLGWSPEFLPWLRWVVLVVGVVAAVAFLVPLSGHRWLMVATIAAVTAGLIAPTAYAVETVLTPRSGPIVTAGPPITQGDASRLGGFHAGFPGMSRTRRGSQGPIPPGDVASTNTELVAILKSAPTKWSAATITGSSAASLELASGTAVLGIGGFMGSDPYPTLDQFKAYLASGQIRYFVAGPIFGERFGGGSAGMPEGGLPGSFRGGDGGHPGRGRPGEFANGTGTQISQWVKENFTPITIDGQTIYNLSQPKT